MEEREPLNAKRRRLQREEALREAVDKIVECTEMYKNDPRYKPTREEVVKLIMKCVS